MIESSQSASEQEQGGKNPAPIFVCLCRLRQIEQQDLSVVDTGQLDGFLG
jgi:hypothetical protein